MSYCYLDADVAYLLGLVVARGTLKELAQVRRLTIEFPYTSLNVHGDSPESDQEAEISVGLHSISRRLLNLLETDIEIVHNRNSIDLVVHFLRNNMTWRNLRRLLDGRTSYIEFRVPHVFFHSDLPRAWKVEFVRGFADVAGNVRQANRYVDGRHRVRLDVLNYPHNWETPVQLCSLLQEHLSTPVQLITWGHPNMGRAFREHQINIFAEPFLQIGFSFRHKQKVLEEFAKIDRQNHPNASYRPCPATRRIRKAKALDPAEGDASRLDTRLVGKHFDAYFQICRELGCKQLHENTEEAHIFTEQIEEENLDR